MDPDLKCSSGLGTRSDNSKKHKTKNFEYQKEVFPNLIARACAFLLNSDQRIAASWNEGDLGSVHRTPKEFLTTGITGHFRSVFEKLGYLTVFH